MSFSTSIYLREEFYSITNYGLVYLQPPSDVYCLKRNTTENSPQPPRVFSYVAEIVTGIDYFDPILQEKKHYRVAQTQKVFNNKNNDYCNAYPQHDKE